MEKKQSKTLPLLALIFGIAALVTSCIPIIGALCGLTSIILAIISFVKKKPIPMPIIGLICSFFGITISVVVLLVGTTLNIALSDNGIFDSAQEASNKYQSIVEEEEEINKILNNIEFSTNKVDNEVIENTIVNETTNESNVSITNNASISSDWTQEEFIIAGNKYKLFDNYSKIAAAGWTFDMTDYGYDDSYVVNANQKTYSTIYLENILYDADISIGLINKTESVATIKECAIWAIDVDNAFADKPVEFELSKGIKNGSSLTEVKAAYGEPSETYYSESLKYWSYTYDHDFNSPELRLTIYEDATKGLTSFSYKHY